MADQADTVPEKRRAKKAGDARGTPPGAGTITPAHGGKIGNPPFVPTDEMRQEVRTLAKAFPLHGEHHIAQLVGIGRSTLRDHLGEEMKIGRAEMLAVIAAQMIQRAIDANAVGPDGTLIAKGDLDAQKFVLARLGGWTTKVDIGTPGMPGGGAPRREDEPDLSRLTDEELELYGRLAAKAEGLDPDIIVNRVD